MAEIEGLTPENHPTTDPAEWVDVSAENGGAEIWRSTRNNFAYSEDGGATFWLADRRVGVDTRPTISTKYDSLPHE